MPVISNSVTVRGTPGSRYQERHILTAMTVNFHIVNTYAQARHSVGDGNSTANSHSWLENASPGYSASLYRRDVHFEVVTGEVSGTDFVTP